MQQFCTYGSVRGAVSNGRPYRDKTNWAGSYLLKHIDVFMFYPCVDTTTIKAQLSLSITRRTGACQSSAAADS
jgi:hypothetical protein